LSWVGIVTHKILKQIAQQGISEWQQTKIETHKQYWQDLLKNAGVNQSAIPTCLEEIGEAINKTVNDPKAQWILDPTHEDARTEFEIQTQDKGKLILDRTFIDLEGIRWIIDYKMSECTDGDMEAFLLEEKKQYTKQLELYADALVLMEDRVVKTALYFPRHAHWEELEANAN